MTDIQLALLKEIVLLYLEREITYDEYFKYRKQIKQLNV